MTANVLKTGQFITSTTTEQEFTCEGGPKTFMLVLESGSVQVATAAPDTPPVINSTYTTYSTAGSKIPIDIHPCNRHLRIIGTGVVSATFVK